MLKQSKLSASSASSPYRRGREERSLREASQNSNSCSVSRVEPYSTPNSNRTNYGIDYYPNSNNNNYGAHKRAADREGNRFGNTTPGTIEVYGRK